MTASRIKLIAPLLMTLIAAGPARAADRVVLLQTEWFNTPPHYVTIQGGRNRDRLTLMLKEGRHAPSDEWILRNATSGKSLLESNDPFYKKGMITFGHPLIGGEFNGAHPAHLFYGQIQHDDYWTIETDPDGFVIFWTCRERAEDYALIRAKYQSSPPVFVFARKITPLNRQEARFKIIDITPKVSTERITPATPTLVSPRSDPAAPP